MTLRIRLLETETTPEYTVPDHSVIRLPVAGIAHRALGCEAAESSIVFDDPGGGFSRDDMDDFRGFVVEETACSEPVIFAGVTTKKTVTRGTAGASPSLITGADRIWSTGLVDDNWQSFRRVIHGSDGNRPAETDVARMQWYIASAYSFHIDDVGLVDTTGGVAMDAFDYTGKFGIDVINDCMKVSGKNCFMYPLQDGSDHHGIAYFFATSTTYSCDLSISNDPADFPDPLDFTDSDSWTTFPCGRDASLDIDPMRKYGGGFLRYTGGFVYVNPGGGPSIRDFSVDEPSVKTRDAALALTNKYLEVSSFAEDIINLSAVVPASLVNKILAGMRIQVKLVDEPGYESFVWRRISNRGVSQYNNRRDLYQLNLELRDPRLIGGIGTGAITVPAGTTNGDLPFTPSDATFVQDGHNFIAGSDRVTMPAAIQAGDLLVAVDRMRSRDVATNPSAFQTTLGFTPIGSGVETGLPVDFNGNGSIIMLYKIADGSEGDTLIGGWDTDHICGVAEFSGVNALAGEVEKSVATANTSMAAGPITIAARSLLVQVAACGDDSTFTAGPTGYSGTTIASTGAGQHPQFGLYYKQQDAGTYTPTSTQSGATTYGSIVAAFALSGQTSPKPGQPILGETPSGDVDGVNATFTTLYPYVPGSLKVWVNGVEWTTDIATQDPATGSFTFTHAPKADSDILVNYQAA